MGNKPHDRMIAFLGLLSGQKALEPISTVTVIDALKPPSESRVEYAAMVETVLSFLAMLGIIHVDWPAGEFTINGLTGVLPQTELDIPELRVSE